MTGAPPFRLPGIHFAGAIVWLVLGGVGLVAVAPDLAVARFLTPQVLAVTHLYTLGVIVASVFGALYQFYPMSLGAAPKCPGRGRRRLAAARGRGCGRGGLLALAARAPGGGVAVPLPRHRVRLVEPAAP